MKRTAGVLKSRRDEAEAVGHEHRDITGGWARAAVFGVSDGLTTNVALILGIAGASAPASFVRLAGLAGLIGGAFSMAAGEWVSMRAQAELLERELAKERRALARRPEAERRELAAIYVGRGIDRETANAMAGCTASAARRGRGSSVSSSGASRRRWIPSHSCSAR